MTTRPRATVRFLKFNRENPHVYHLFVRFTREAVSRWGSGVVGIRGVIDRARWEPGLQTTGRPYKLHENFSPFYARLIMYLNSDLQGVFTLRQSVADDPGRQTHPDQGALWEEAQQDNGWLEEAARAVEDSH